MKTKFTVMALSLTLILVSCGKSNNRTNDNGAGGNITGQLDGGLDVNASLSAKLTRIERAFPCEAGVRRYTVGFRVQNYAFAGRHTVSLNSNNAKGVYVGRSIYNDVVLVKELTDSVREVRVRICDVDRFQSRITQISSADIVSDFSFSPVSSCTVNQISKLNLVLHYTQFNSIPLEIFPVNAEGAVTGVCPTDFRSDPVLLNYNQGLNGGFYGDFNFLGGW